MKFSIKESMLSVNKIIFDKSKNLLLCSLLAGLCSTSYSQEKPPKSDEHLKVKICLDRDCVKKNAEDEHLKKLLKEVFQESVGENFKTCQYSPDEQRCIQSFISFAGKGIGIFNARTGFVGFTLTSVSDDTPPVMKVEIENYPWIFGDDLNETNLKSVSHQRCEPTNLNYEQTNGSLALTLRNYRCHGRIYSFWKNFLMTLVEINLETGRLVFSYHIDISDGATGSGQGFTTLEFGNRITRLPGYTAVSELVRRTEVTIPPIGNLIRDVPVQQTSAPTNEVAKLRAEAEEAKRKRTELEQQLRLAQNQPQANVPQANQPPPTINQGRRVALVIGNASYSSVPQLINPTNDAREVTRALQATGFEVIRLENADLRQMQDAVRSFGNRLSKNDVGLFYFSGHGVQVKGKNYLIPVRENIKQSFEVPSGAIDADLVLATMENAKNNLNIMILDACRSPFPGEARSLSRGLATLDAAKGTLIAYATAPGKEALDGQGSNSPYTKHLVRALQQKGLPIEQVFKQVRIAVVEETKGNQVPWENSSIMGDFYFRK
jgi:hypothetical protein